MRYTVAPIHLTLCVAFVFRHNITSLVALSRWILGVFSSTLYIIVLALKSLNNLKLLALRFFRESIHELIKLEWVEVNTRDWFSAFCFLPLYRDEAYPVQDHVGM